MAGRVREKVQTFELKEETRKMNVCKALITRFKEESEKFIMQW